MGFLAAADAGLSVDDSAVVLLADLLDSLAQRHAVALAGRQFGGDRRFNRAVLQPCHRRLAGDDRLREAQQEWTAATADTPLQAEPAGTGAAVTNATPESSVAAPGPAREAGDAGAVDAMTAATGEADRGAAAAEPDVVAPTAEQVSLPATAAGKAAATTPEPGPAATAAASTAAAPIAAATKPSVKPARVESSASQVERLVTTPSSAPRVSTTAAASTPTTDVAAPQRRSRRTTCKAALAQTRRPYCVDTLPSGQKGPALVVLPRGAFEMGGDGEHERPRHRVSIDRDLAIGIFEVSAADLQLYCAASGPVSTFLKL